MPTPAAARSVERCWSFRATRSGATTILPDGRSDLILRFRVARTERASGVTPILCGPATRPYGVRYRAGDAWLGLRLRPELSRTLWRCATGPIVDRICKGKQAENLVPALRTLPLHTPRIADLEAALLQVSSWLADGHPATRAAQAVRLLHISGGRIRVADLALSLNCSERQLHRSFLQALGLTPKAYAMIVQFHRALNLLQGSVAAANVAFESGYADQAHMVRAFQTFGGFSPANVPSALSLPGFE